MKFNSSLTSTVLVTAATTVTLSFLGSNAQAALLIGNIDTATANQGNQVNGSDNEFVSFVTPDDGLLRTIEDITVQFSNSGIGTGIFDATLLWYDGGLPANGDPTGVSPINLGTESVTVTAGQANNFVFDPSQTLTLLPNTTYGFRINGTSGSGLTWLSQFVSGNNDSTYTSEVGASFVQAYRTLDTGTSWTPQSSQRIFDITVSDETTAVPEPTAVIGLLVFGISGLALGGQKRKNTK